MEQIKLNKENPEVEFNLNAADSYLLIQSVSVTSQKDGENQWTNFISKVKLTAELKYAVLLDPQGLFVDERKKQFPIHFIPDLYKVQPVFHLNTSIKNESFTLGIDPEQKFYHTLKLELQDYEQLDNNHSLEFNVEKFKIEEKK